MATEVVLPKLGFSMTEAKLTEWCVGDGEEVAAGAPLYVIESDKSSNEVESPAPGLLRIHRDAGEVYPVGEILGVIE